MPSPGSGDAGKVPAVTVPKVNTDPAMSLCPWSVQVSLGNGFVEIKPYPAIDWLKYLLGGQPDIDGLVTELLPEVEDFFFENDLDLYDMYSLVLDIIGVVSARPWWIAMRLISLANGSWSILGPKMIMSQIDTTTLSLAAWLDVVLFLAIENMDPKDVTMFNLRLEAAPPEIFGKTIEVEEEGMDRNAFLAFGS